MCNGIVRNVKRKACVKQSHNGRGCHIISDIRNFEHTAFWYLCHDTVRVLTIDKYVYTSGFVKFCVSAILFYRNNLLLSRRIGTGLNSAITCCDC